MAKPDTSLNPEESAYKKRFSGIKRTESSAVPNGVFASPLGSGGGQNTNPLADLKNSEEYAGAWNSDLYSQATKLALKVPRIKKSGVGWLVGGGAGMLGLILTFIALIIPLKLQGMIENIMTAASQVPQYAVEQRVEYLVTRALASRMLAASSDVDAQLIFCKSGGIACSLIKTYTNDYFEKKLGIELDIKDRGRTSLAGSARSWSVGVELQTVDPSNKETYIKPGVLNGKIDFDETQIEKARKLISSNSEMKKLIYKEVNSKTRWNHINRYLVRKLLMNKYGVRTFSGPKWVQDGKDKLTNVRTNMKASITKNTVGKIAPRFATYMTCISDTITCEKLKDGIKADIEKTDPKNRDDWKDLSPEEQERLQKGYDTQKSILIDIEADGYSEESGKAIKNIFSKSLMKTLGVVAGATTVVSAADFVFKVVESTDNGGPEMIAYDIVTQSYTGFSTDITTTIQKVIAGDMDMETLNAATELFDGAENSPLYKAENSPSSLSGTVSAASGGYVTSCKGSDGNETQTVLEEGELICPEEYAVRDYTSQLASNPVFSGISEVAKLWNDSAGVVVDWVNGFAGDVINNVPGFKPLMNKVGTTLEPLMEKIMSMFFDIPAMGPGELGSHNYTALSGGTRVSQNALMEEGVDNEGKAMGGGGTVLTNEQIVAINTQSAQDEATEYASRSLADKIFDTSTRQSFVSQIIARIPMSFNSISTLPISSLFSALSSSSVGAAGSNTTPNPFHLPIYGYAVGDPVLSASPDVYTPESCAASATARADSYSRDAEKGELIPVYHKADPCALEKIVIGSELAEQGIEGDEYSFQSIQDVAIPGQTAPVSTDQSPAAVGDVAQDSSNVACASGTEDQGVADGYKSGKRIQIRLCAIPGTYSRSSEDAKYGRKIVVNSRVSGPAIAMINKMKSDLGMATANFTSSFRTNSVQSSLYSAYINGTGNVASRPGFSNHQLGTAFDVDFGGGISNKSAYCKSATIANICRPPKASAIYDWLNANAKKYGFSQYYKEYWHWEYK